MNLHEYQSKKLFAEYAIPIPKGQVADSAEAAEAAARGLGGSLWVVKAQVHAGGRGKAGGVKVVKDLEAVRAAAKAMLGTTLVTHQTGPEGLPVHQVYVEVGSKIAREIYLSLVLNRDASRLAFVASAAGGMDIEEVAEHSPEKIIRINVNPTSGLQDFQCRQLAFGLGFKGAQIAQFGKIAHAIYKLYLERDASLVEVNPLIVTADGDLLALDAKINIEDNLSSMLILASKASRSPSAVTMSGLTSTKLASRSRYNLYIAWAIFPNCAIWAPLNPRPNASCRHWKSCNPEVGFTLMRM